MKVDTEKEFELAQKYKIRSLPTVVSLESVPYSKDMRGAGAEPRAQFRQMAFKNGQVIGQFIGAQQEAGVRKFLEDIKSK